MNIYRFQRLLAAVLLLLLQAAQPDCAWAGETGAAPTACAWHPDSVGRQGVLLVYFGTTHDANRELTLDALTLKARSRFADCEVCEAYASEHVVKSLARRGIEKLSPVEGLLRLRSQGCRRVRVLPTFLIDGKEMGLLERDVERLRPFFDSISLARPLLSDVARCEQVCEFLATRHPANAKQRKHVVFVGHGTQGAATAVYAQLDYMLRAGGHACHHVATIEGYPTFDTLLRQLRAQKARTVTLVPLLFVAGDHATNDIAVDWKQYLEQQGLRVEVHMEGLGQVPELQEMFLDNTAE